MFAPLGSFCVVLNSICQMLFICVTGYTRRDCNSTTQLNKSTYAVDNKTFYVFLALEQLFRLDFLHHCRHIIGDFTVQEVRMALDWTLKPINDVWEKLLLLKCASLHLELTFIRYAEMVLVWYTCVCCYFFRFSLFKSFLISVILSLSSFFHSIVHITFFPVYVDWRALEQSSTYGWGKFQILLTQNEECSATNEKK